MSLFLSCKSPVSQRQSLTPFCVQHLLSELFLIPQSFLQFPIVQPLLQTFYRVQRTRTNVSRSHQQLRFHTSLVGGRISPGAVVGGQWEW